MSKIIANNGTVMKVAGEPFGTNNQFIEWVGPALESSAECAEENAIFYLRRDGSAYFGSTKPGCRNGASARIGVKQ